MSTGAGIEYTCNPLFDHYDFSIEPEQSWIELLVEHAQLIRDNFGTLRLWYSGGIDSDLMLDVFLQNNIHLDEIHVNMHGIPGAQFEQQYALDRLKNYADKLNKVKIIQHNFTKESLYNEYNRQNWTWKGSDIPSRCFRFTLFPYGREEVAPDTCDIFGHAKPNIFKYHGKWYAYVLDGAMHGNQMEGLRGYRQFFYADHPLVYIKQLHMVKNYIQSHYPTDQINKICFSQAWGNSVANYGTGRYVYNPMHNLPKGVVLGTKQSTVSHNNQTHYFINHKDSAAFESARNDNDLWKIYERWRENADYASNKFRPWLKLGRWEMDSVGVFDKIYCLDENISYTVDQLFPNGFDTQQIIKNQESNN